MKRKKVVLLSIIGAIITCLSVSLAVFLPRLKNPADAIEENPKLAQVAYTPPEEFNGTQIIVSDKETLNASKIEKGGAIYVEKGTTFTLDGGSLYGDASGKTTYGGVVYVESGATFHMKKGTIVGGFAKYGGAIYVEAGGILKIEGGTIENNFAQFGYSIYIQDGVDENGDIASVNIDNVELKNNNYKFHSGVINYYVNGQYSASAIAKNNQTGTRNVIGEETNAIFDIDYAPLNYENCPGYFLDEDLRQQIELEDKIYEYGTADLTVYDPIFNKDGEINVYTKTATTNVLKFTESSDGYNVEALNTEIEGEVVIPKAFLDYGARKPLLVIGTKNVVLPSDVDDYLNGAEQQGAFYNQNKITSVVMPSTLTSIDSYSFFGCEKLSTVYIGSNITNIGTLVYGNCHNIEEIEVSENNKNFTSADGKNCIISTTNKELMYGCQNTAIPTNSELVVSIGDYAYFGNKNLITINISDNITKIGVGSFQNCNKLEEIEVGLGLLSVENNAFLNVNSTENNGQGVLNIKSLTSWCNIDFSNANSNPMSALKVVNDSDSDSDNTLITIPTGITTLKQYTFCNYDTLSTLIIPDSVTSISSSTFIGCISIKNLSVGNGLESFNKGLFGGCANLVNLSTYSKIDDTGFNKLLNLKQITINANIGASAFSGCSSLDIVTFGTKNLNIKSDVFKGCVAVSQIFATSEELWYSLNFENNYSNPMAGTSNETLYIVGDDNLETFVPTKNLGTIEILEVEDVVIPEFIIEIKPYLFCGYEKLKSLTIPNNVSLIGDYAFSKCGNSEFTDLEISSSVTSIGKNAFNACKYLENLILNNGLIEIGERAFYDCESVLSLTIPNSVSVIGNSAFIGCDNLEELIIGSGLTEGVTSAMFGFNSSSKLKTLEINSNIGKDVFSNIKALTRVVIGPDISTIENNAFINCTEVLSVYSASVLNSTTSSLDSWCKIRFGNAYSNPMFSSNQESFYINSNKQSDLIYDVYNNQFSTIKNYAFAGASFGKIELYDEINKIEDNAFYKCTATSLYADLEIDILNQSIFSGMKNSLVDLYINLGYNLDDYKTSSTIESNCFNNFSKLVKVEIGNHVESIGTAFSGCPITDLTIGEGLGVVQSWNFVTQKESLVNLNVQCGIGHEAFKDFKNLNHIVLGNNLILNKKYYENESVNTTEVVNKYRYQNLFDDSFIGCENIVTLKLLSPNYRLQKMVEQKNYDEYGNEYINTVSTTLGWYYTTDDNGKLDIAYKTILNKNHFAGCTNLVNLTINCDIEAECSEFVYNEDIGNVVNCSDCNAKHGAFANIPSLQNLVIGSGCDKIVGNAFYQEGKEDYKKDSNKWLNFMAVDTKKSVGDGWQWVILANEYSNPMRYAKNIYTYDTEVDDFYDLNHDKKPDLLTLVAFGLSSDINIVSKYSFFGCSSLTTIQFGNQSSVGVEKNAFADCVNLTTLENFGNVKYIEELSFAGCDNIEIIDYGMFSEGASIAPYAFANMTSLTKVDLSCVTEIGEGAFSGCTKLSSVTLSNKLKTIPYMCFANTGLTKLVVPESVEKIEKYAFLNCSNLTAIKIKNLNVCESESLVHTYTDYKIEENDDEATITKKIVSCLFGAIKGGFLAYQILSATVVAATATITVVAVIGGVVVGFVLAGIIFDIVCYVLDQKQTESTKHSEVKSAFTGCSNLTIYTETNIDSNFNKTKICYGQDFVNNSTSVCDTASYSSYPN